MAICTREAGLRRIWHPSGAGAGLDLHPWVHPHLTRGGSGFQSTPAGPHWAPVYSSCTTILGPEPAGTRNPPQNPWTPETRPETRGHQKPAPKPADTRWPTPCQNPRAPETHPETRRVRVQFSPTDAGAGAGFHPSAFWGGAGFW
jgi:hypothetical protein